MGNGLTLQALTFEKTCNVMAPWARLRARAPQIGFWDVLTGARRDCEK
jgi:hypothetical protein